MLRIALLFSLVYLAELILFGIGAFKEGGGRGLVYCFLAVLAVLWAAFVAARKSQAAHKAPVFFAFALFLCLWVVPGWRIEIAVEQRLDRETIENLRRVQVFNVSDEPFLGPQGKPLGVRIRYSVRFPLDGIYPPAPILEPADKRGRRLRVVGAAITPRPLKALADASGTDTYGRYRGNLTYSFTVDLVPGFVIVSRDRSKSCLSFQDENERAIVSSPGTPVRFSVHIDGTDYGGYFGGPPQFTSQVYDLGEFYRNALENGARASCQFDAQGEMQ